MPKYAATYETFTPTGVSNATNFTDNGYWALQGQTASQQANIYEVFLVGQSTSSQVNSMVLARDTVNGGTLTALTTLQSNAAINAGAVSVTSAPVAYSAATTKPQRSLTHAKLVLGFNACGGVVRWYCPPGCGAEFTIVGNTTPLSEASVSCTTIGTPGPMMATIQYELV